MITAELVATMAQEVEMSDPIDFGMLNISEHDAFMLMANGMLDQYNSTDPADRELMLLAVATKLIVENFVLNLKLHSAPNTAS